MAREKERKEQNPAESWRMERSKNECNGDEVTKIAVGGKKTKAEWMVAF